MHELSTILNINELEEFLNNRHSGLIFCFGTSMISKIIQIKTREYDTEIVPSHVAMFYGNHIYESTTDIVHIGHKTIGSGVRRWLISDFIKSEHRKQTKYAVLNMEYFERDKADSYVHLPYGKDTILDFLLKDGSDGDSHGLICSQYANLVTGLLPKKKCPSPAELYRQALKITEGQLGVSCALKIKSVFSPKDRLNELTKVPKLPTGEINYWRAAQLLCKKDGGRLPTMKELAQLATYIYERKITAYDDYSGLTIKNWLPALQSIYSKNNCFHLWAQDEYSSSYAYYRSFYADYSNYYYGGRDDPGPQALCVEED